jgi:uncharacterized protein YyaL (SSP411 family)
MLTAVLTADIAWQKDVPTAIELAKKEHKPLMVFVEGENCRWCKKMKHRVLSDENVEKRLQAFVCVKVMREDTSAVKDLPVIEGVPSIFFMTADQKILESVLGYYNVDDFISFITTTEEKIKPVKTLISN